MITSILSCRTLISASLCCKLLGSLLCTKRIGCRLEPFLSRWIWIGFAFPVFLAKVWLSKLEHSDTVLSKLSSLWLQYATVFFSERCSQLHARRCQILINFVIWLSVHHDIGHHAHLVKGSQQILHRSFSVLFSIQLFLFFISTQVSAYGFNFIPQVSQVALMNFVSQSFFLLLSLIESLS